ncbi:MAG: diaminopimelate epimerase [Pirellulales bacterium]
MRFTKMQGAGNDYVYVDCFREKFPRDPAALAQRIADRHFGVGGDGLILICPSERADVRMRMYNADGSESEMCGNGVRCVAKYVYDHGIAKKSTLAIETGNGVLTIDL